MIIGVLSIRLYISYSETIKERRNRVRSMKDSIRKKFNVSVSEIIDNPIPSVRSTLAVVAVSNDHSRVNSVLSNVFNLIERHYPDIIESYTTEFLVYED